MLTGPELDKKIKAREKELARQKSRPAKAKHSTTCEQNFDYKTLGEGDEKVVETLVNEIFPD